MADGIPMSKETPLKDTYEETVGIGVEAGGTDVESGWSSSSSDSSDDEWRDQSESPIQLYKDQRELAQHALQGKNTIIFSVPGSGKTWIAMHIAWMHLQDKSKSPRKIVFMARTGALIKQQAETFQENLNDFKIKLISAQDGDAASFLAMYVEQNDIVCLTPQILINSLEKNALKSISEFSLMIFDECHHTKGETPYNQLMRKYLIEKIVRKNERLPQIVGLTGSIGIGKARTEEDAIHQILELCANLDVRQPSVVDKHEKSLKKRTSIAKKETIQLDKTRGNDLCKEVILRAMSETENFITENALMQPDLIDMITEKLPSDRESQEYNNWTNEIKTCAQQNVGDGNVSRDIRSCARYLSVYNSALEQLKLHPAEVIKYFATMHQQEGQHFDTLTELERRLYQRLQGVQKSLNVNKNMKENRNVHILSDTLEKLLKEKGRDSRAIVAVKTRATCRSLATYLDKVLLKSSIRVSPLYGKEDRNGEEGMSDDVQTKCLERFREGYYKVIVCTSVGNEGIDIPACNIVISYEYSGDEITSIQLKGRARKTDALAVTLGSEKILEQEKRNAFKEELMVRALEELKKKEQWYIEEKVSFIQQDIMKETKMKDELNKLKKEMQTNLNQDLLCERCDTFACPLTDVRKMGHDHIVVNSEFKNKIKKKIHKKPMVYNDINKKYKMYCKMCPNDWGIVGVKSGLEYMILKIKNFKFRDQQTNAISTYKNWKGLNIAELSSEDIQKLKGRQEEECSQNESGMVKPEVTNETCTIYSRTTSKLGEAMTNLKRPSSSESSKEPLESNKIGRQEKECSQSEGGTVKPEDTNETCPIDYSRTTSKLFDTKTDLKRPASSESSNELLESNKKGKLEEKDTIVSSPSTSSSTGFPLKKSHDDTLSEPLVNIFSEKMKSVGALVVAGEELGTVFRVGTKYVMTAWHVVKPIVEQGNSIDPSEVYVTFSPKLLAPDRTIYHLTNYLVCDVELDVAVLEINNPDIRLPPGLQLCQDENTYLHLEEVSLIGYGHPKKNGKHLDPRCKILSSTHGQILSAQKWLEDNSLGLKSIFIQNGKPQEIVDNAYRGLDNSNRLIFHCYMQQGASGSPTFSNNIARPLQVVGILTHGLPEFYYILDDETRKCIMDDLRFEVGTKMTSIHRSIKNQDPSLASDIFS